MKYTTTEYRLDSGAQTIEVFKPTNFIDFYRTLVKVWGSYTPFCAVWFPHTITDMFPVTKETAVPVGVMKWR
jgi:hypothetical protein